MKKNTNVLLIGPLTKVGGLSKYVKDILTTNFEQKIIHFNIARPVKKKVKKTAIGYKELFNAGIVRMITGVAVTLWHMFIFPFILVFKGPKIIHIAATGDFVFWEDSFYVLISRLFGKKVFLHYLGSFDIYYNKSGSFHKRFIKYILLKCHFIGILSKKVQNLVADITAQPYKLVLIPSSVDFSLFENKKTLIPRDETIKVLFLGGFDAYKKGISDILKVIPEITSENPTVKFVITSSKKLDIDLDEKIKNKIIFFEWIADEDKIPLYNSCDIFLLPSYDEGLPYSMIEAMAAGLPVISTYIGGIPEVIEKNINGFLLSPGDLKSLKESITKLIQDKKMRQEMSVNNKEKIKNEYSLESNTVKIKTIYSVLLK